MRSAEDRFWEKVDKGPHPRGCLMWTGAKIPAGYGSFGMNGSQVGAHVFSWELVHGPVPKGKVLRHTCDVKLCVNEEHLVPGTKKQNSEDMVSRGRQACGDRHGSHTHPERVARGSRLPQTKVREEQREEMRALRAQGWNKSSLATKFSVSASQVYRICKGVL